MMYIEMIPTSVLHEISDTVETVMIPKDQVDYVILGNMNQYGIQRIVDSKHHYLPLLGKHDEVMGILFKPDVLQAMAYSSPFNAEHLEKYAGPAFVLICTDTLKKARTTMKRQKQPVACVIDTQWKFIGLITERELYL